VVAILRRILGCDFALLPPALSTDTGFVRKLVTVVICTLVLAAPAAAGSPLPLPALTRIASKASGLRVKSRPTVVFLGKAAMEQQTLRLLDRDYAPDQQAYDETLYRALGLLADAQTLRPSLVEQANAGVGRYDALRRAVYLRAGSAPRRAVLRELVHVLQDQRFNLRRLVGLRAWHRDAAIAAAGATDAHAAFVSGMRNGRPVGPAESRLDTFLAVESAFPTTTGVRFISTLQDLGGKRAIFTALQRFPETSEQLLHIDAFLEREPAVAIALPTAIGKFGRTREDTFGELDVRALLAAFAVPRRDGVGTGWGGGRTALYRDPTGRQAVVVALDWDEAADADQWAAAVAAYVNAAFGMSAPTSCGATACWSGGGRELAFEHDGVRTALVFGPTVADAATIAQQITSS
jgi:hypothetical protein